MFYDRHKHNEKLTLTSDNKTWNACQQKYWHDQSTNHSTVHLTHYVQMQHSLNYHRFIIQLQRILH